MQRTPLLLSGWLILSPAMAAPEWPPEFGLQEQTQAVNEGKLELLATPPGTPVHQHINHITISARSLKDGWIRLEQCHLDLDPVPAVEIIFHPKRIRGLQITESINIASAHAEVNKVLLKGVSKDARLCLEAESKALHILPDGQFELRNGPYMRRFLDGYYPMLVKLTVQTPAELVPIETFPHNQKGFSVVKKQGLITMKGWFKGKLFTRIRFSQINSR